MQFPVLEYSLFPVRWWKVITTLIQFLTRKHDVVFRVLLASIRRKVLTTWLWSSEDQGVRQEEEPEDGHALPAGQHPWSLVGRPVPISSPDLPSSQTGLRPCHRQLQKELEAGTATAPPGTGPISKEWVGAQGKAEQGCKSLFLPSGAWQSCVLLSSSVQLLRISHSSWPLSECTPSSSLLDSLIFFPVLTFLSLYAGHYYLSSVPVSHWKNSVTWL